MCCLFLFAFEVLLVLWFVFECLVQLQMCKKCLFSRFLGLGGCFILLYLGLEGLRCLCESVFLFVIIFFGGRGSFCFHFSVCWSVLGVVLFLFWGVVFAYFCWFLFVIVCFLCLCWSVFLVVFNLFAFVLFFVFVGVF